MEQLAKSLLLVLAVLIVLFFLLPKEITDIIMYGLGGWSIGSISSKLFKKEKLNE